MSNQEPMEKPIVTIITVVKNGEKHLESTIQSVINQSYDKIEYIIIDGGSTDGTLDIIRKYENFISYWISEPDRGLYDAMNKGWRLASENSYILFLGAGDKIIQLPDFSKNNEPTLAIWGRVMIEDSKIYNSAADFRLKLGNTLHHQALLISKSLSIQPPFNTRYKVYADYDFNCRLLNQGVKFQFSEDFISYASPAGVSGKLSLKESLQVVKINFGFVWTFLSILYHLYQGFKYGFHRLSFK